MNYNRMEYRSRLFHFNCTMYNCLRLLRVNLRIQLAVLVKPLTRKGFTSQHALALKFSLYSPLLKTRK